MIVDVVLVRGDMERRGNVFATYDRAGMLGLRAEANSSTVYVDLATLEYLIDEARRAQSTSVPEAPQ